MSGSAPGTSTGDLEPGTVDPRSNALDSLRRCAAEAGGLPARDPLALKGVLWWGWHAVPLLAMTVLRPAADSIDPWLGDYLDAGERSLATERDARWQERQRLSLLELVDLLSEEELPILEPELYQGWQDRVVRCRTLRRQAAAVVGGAIGEEERAGLLYLLAAYHRLLRMPAAVELDPARVERTLPRLFDLLDRLAAATADPEPVREAVAACRRAVGAAA